MSTHSVHLGRKKEASDKGDEDEDYEKLRRQKWSKSPVVNPHYCMTPTALFARSFSASYRGKKRSFLKVSF